MTIQQARTVKIRHDCLSQDRVAAAQCRRSSNSSDRFPRTLTNLKSGVAFFEYHVEASDQYCADPHLRETVAIGMGEAPRLLLRLRNSRGDILKRQATMSQLEIIVQTEKALANAKNCALALVDIAETLAADRRFIVQQIAWSIQNELDTASQCLRNQKERTSLAASSSDPSAVIRLTPKAIRDTKPDT